MKLHELKLTDVIPEDRIDHNQLSKETTHHLPLDSDELKVVQKYTANSFQMNNALHTIYSANKIPLDMRDNTEVVAQTKLMNKIIHNHPITRDLTLFSGVSFDIADLWKIRKVDRTNSITIHFPSFTSCTTDMAQAISFANEIKTSIHKQHSKHERLNDEDESEQDAETISSVLMFKIKTGDPVLSVAQYSYSKDEWEYILPAGCTISINPKPLKRVLTPRKTIVIWQCEITFGHPAILDERITPSIKVISNEVSNMSDIHLKLKMMVMAVRHLFASEVSAPDEPVDPSKKHWNQYLELCMGTYRRFDTANTKFRAKRTFTQFTIFAIWLCHMVNKPVPKVILDSIKFLKAELDIDFVDITSEFRYSEFSKIMTYAELHELLFDLIEH